jgi:uncharacterized protein
MRSLHFEKKAIRALGIAESFRSKADFSTVAGVVLRSDLVIDGFALGQFQVAGSDATSEVERLYKSMSRNDINALFLSGSVLSLYNVLDVDQIHSATKIPVLALSFSKSRANLAANIRARFSQKEADQKVKLLEKLGPSSEIKLSTGYKIFVRSAGINQAGAKKLLDKFTLQGGVPEPVRVAKLLAKALAAAPKT